MEEGPSRNWRARGWVMVAAGVFLILLMAAIVRAMAPAMLRPGASIDGTTFTGSPQQAQLFLGLLGLVALFGALSALNGLYMIAAGRRSPAGARLLLALFFLLFALGWAVRRGLV
jgi:hypothetical protein